MHKNVTVYFVMFYTLVCLFSVKCFEYWIWMATAKDFPWYIDFIGGILLIGFNFLLAFIALILYSCGIEPGFIIELLK